MLVVVAAVVGSSDLMGSLSRVVEPLVSEPIVVSESMEKLPQLEDAEEDVERTSFSPNGRVKYARNVRLN